MPTFQHLKPELARNEAPTRFQGTPCGTLLRRRQYCMPAEGLQPRSLQWPIFRVFRILRRRIDFTALE